MKLNGDWERIRGRESLLTASSELGDTTFIEQRFSWSWLEGQGTIFKTDRRTNQRGRESLLTASSAPAFSSSPGLLSWSVKLRSLIEKTGGSCNSVSESGFNRLHYAGWLPRLYTLNFYHIVARRLRRSVLVMIIPLHIAFARIISCLMIPAMGGERRV
jgi:hypothetical protein